MPKITLKKSHEFWKGYEDDMIYRVISFMETVENWTVDGNKEIEKALEDLGEALDDVVKFELDKEDNYIRLFSYLKMSRVLLIMQTIDTMHPGSASRLLMHAEENNEGCAELFLRRNIVFERFRLIGRVFSKKRLELVISAMEKQNEV